MSRFLSDKYQMLKAYTPGEQPREAGLIKLNTNESPFPPSPKVIEAIDSSASAGLNRYSDPDAAWLVKAISRYYNISENRIIVGNGSDELLAFSFMIFQNQNRKIYFPDITYGFYKVYAEVFGADARRLRLNDHLTIDIEGYFNLDGTIVLANPNPPAGTAVSCANVENILKTNKNNLVIIDEAYVNFGAESGLQLIEKYDNLLVIQTFSKDRNLAGARIGMAFGHEEIIKDLHKIRYSFNPYNLNRLSILAGAASVSDKGYYEMCTEKIKAVREKFVSDMENLGFFIIPSLANFVLVRHDKISGYDYYIALKEKNILVRYINEKRIGDYVRITIGSEEDMEALTEATKEIFDRGEGLR